MVANDDEGYLNKRGAQATIASRLAPTGDAATKCRNQIGQSQSLKFARKVTRQQNQGFAPV
jgi:hypothetical protein